MKKLDIPVKVIDACLPQTQCKECGYDGCIPYAKAMVAGDADIDLCPPGGLRTLTALGELLDRDITPYRDKVLEQTRQAQVVVIDEDRCIGCTKCIQACPVDAIMGAAKQMHTVLRDECTGCELCIAPCPVDCIDIVAIDARDDAAVDAMADHSRQRYQNRNARIIRRQAQRAQKHAKNKKQAHLDYINAAISRVQAKRKGQSND